MQYTSKNRAGEFVCAPPGKALSRQQSAQPPPATVIGALPHGVQEVLDTPHAIVLKPPAHTAVIPIIKIADRKNLFFLRLF